METTPPLVPSSISSTEWMSISRSLEDHHALFYHCWQMGRPRFTESIKTAAVRFNKATGEYLDFLFNPTFWQSLTPYERLFVIAHECLHVILNHGLRSRDSKDEDATNWALDVVVNHMLVNNFGFNRDEISMKDLCWVDTVFEDHPELSSIPTDNAFEFYLNMIPKRRTIKLRLLDEHGMPDDWIDAINKIGKKLSPEELSSIKGTIGKHSQGDGLGVWQTIEPGQVKKIKKWETIIENWSKIYLRDVDRHKEQWLRVNRRFWGIRGGLLLPSEQEVIEQQGDRVEVYFFLDTSGSCYHLRERFFRAALSLSEEHFVIRLFCFDTTVEETSLKSKRIYGGGGTFFHIIEEEIVKRIRSEGAKYPEAVFVISDGDGTAVEPKFPRRWHWFLTPRHKTGFIHHDSKKYNLVDYE